MEKKPDQWDVIAGWIRRDKQTALDDFRRRPFAAADRPGRADMPLLRSRPVFRPAFIALAVSLLLLAGLAFFWTRNAAWRVESTASAAARVLADSLLYSRAGVAESGTPSRTSLPPATPSLTAWVEAGLAPLEPDVPAHPAGQVEHGDPEQVRRRIGRAIAANAFERLLLTMRETHNKEA
jgi:hypothetical protein